MHRPCGDANAMNQSGGKQRHDETNDNCTTVHNTVIIIS